MAVVINDTIFDNMPVLVVGVDDAKVNKAKKEAFYTLQTPLKKTDIQVEDESQYTNQERLLVAYYSLYLLTSNHVNIVVANEQGVVTDRVEKKLVADVTEIEYETNKNAIGSEMSIEMAKSRVCNLAREMGIGLGLCSNPNEYGSFTMIQKYPLF